MKPLMIFGIAVAAMLASNCQELCSAHGGGRPFTREEFDELQEQLRARAAGGK